MNIVRCTNGHFFDYDKYPVCPHCGAQIENKPAPQNNPFKKGLFSRLVRLKPERQTSYRKNESFNVGELIDHRYQITKRLSSNTMGNIYISVDLINNQTCVLKEHLGNDNEIQFLKKLSCQGIPHIIESFVNNERNILVMDYWDGQNLGELLVNQGPQPLQTVVKWGTQLCDILQYLHEQKPPIAHCDIKPGNIILQPNGQLVLIDFGAACEYGNTLTHRDVYAISVGFTPPELYNRSILIDERTDLFSLGATLFTLLSGKRPPESVYDINTLLGEYSALYAGTYIEKVLDKCLQKDINKRYASFKELKKALNRSVQFGKFGVFKKITCLTTRFKACFFGAHIPAYSKNIIDLSPETTGTGQTLTLKQKTDETDYYANAIVSSIPRALR